MGITFNHSYVFHKMISDFKEQNGKVTFFEFAKIVADRRINKESNIDDVLDAYVFFEPKINHHKT